MNAPPRPPGSEPSPGTDVAAEATAPPRRTARVSDDDELLTMLGSGGENLHSLRVIHLHLSLLDQLDGSDRSVAHMVLNEVVRRSPVFRSFDLSNGDVICFYKGLKLSVVADVCRKLEEYFLARRTLTRDNPYKERSLFTVMELSRTYIQIIRFVEDLTFDPDMDGDGKNLPALTPDELARLERAVGLFDMSPFLLNQPVVRIDQRNTDDLEYLELYHSIKAVGERLAPHINLQRNRWLFQHLAQDLDYAALRALNHDFNFAGGHRVGINVSLASIRSDEFAKFDARLPPTHRGTVVLEISLTDILTHLDIFHDVVQYAREREFRIAIDSLSPFVLAHFDVEELGADYVKVIWSRSVTDIDEAILNRFRERIAAQRRAHTVLCRCDTITGLLFARDCGIPYVQGRAVDTILRTNTPIGKAMATAS